MAIVRRLSNKIRPPEPDTKPKKVRAPSLHDELVQRGLRWAKARCSFAVAELSTLAMERPDVYGYGFECTSLVIECKTSREDFRADAGKHWRMCPERGMGNFRYYMCPPEIIVKADLPEHWGLLWVHRNKVQVVHLATPQPFAYKQERVFLASIARRFAESYGMSLFTKQHTTADDR